MTGLNKVLLLALLGVSFAFAQEGGDAGDTDDPLQAIKDQNAAVAEKIKLLENQKKLAGLYFPSIPERLEPSFTREGTATLPGSIAAFQALKTIASMMAARIQGGDSATTPAISEQDGCPSLSGGKLDRCKEHLERFNAWAQSHFPDPPPTNPQTYGPILIQGQTEAQHILALQGLLAQLDLVDKRVTCALDPNAADCRPGTVQKANVTPFIGPAIQAVVDIFKFFRTKTTVSTLTLDPDEVAMASMLSAELRRRKVGDHVYATSQFPPNLTKELSDSALLVKLENSQLHVAAIERRIRDLGIKKSDAPTDNESRAPPSGPNAPEIAQLTALKTSIAAVLDSIAGKDGSHAELASYLRSERILDLMKQTNAAVLQVKVHLAGAEMTTKEKFGAVNESHAGGAIASYVLYKATSGEILSSGTFQDRQVYETQ